MSKSLSEIIEVLRPGHIGNDNTYVGAQYTIAQLIEDLQGVGRTVVQLERDLESTKNAYEAAYEGMIAGLTND